jgi:hypothetical protein
LVPGLVIRLNAESLVLTGSVQYENADGNVFDCGLVYWIWLFDSVIPLRSGYSPVRVLMIPPAVCEIRIVWSLLSSVPFAVRKFFRFGICSRSEGTFGLSRNRCVLSNWIETTC